MTPRGLVALLLIAGAVGGGCRRAAPAPAESPDRAAARILDLARGLEKEHRTREAFAAYRQIGRQFPATPAAREAAERLDRARRDAIRGKR